jgi:hypothetical protein
VQAEKTIKYDIDGYDILTDALKTLLNQYPGLEAGEKIKFTTLKEDSGIAFEPVSGAVIYSSKKYITGLTDQLCDYPFYIIYRTALDSQESKIDIKEFLDNMGKWLEKQPVAIDNTDYKLDQYPPLKNGRTIEEITRTSPSYPEELQENGVQDWVIGMTLRYRYKFKK